MDVGGWCFVIVYVSFLCNTEMQHRETATQRDCTTQRDCNTERLNREGETQLHSITLTSSSDSSERSSMWEEKRGSEL